MADGAEITNPLDHPYFEGDQDGLATRFGFMPVAFENREFMVDLTSKMYERRHVQLLRSKQNRAPKDSLLVEPEIWRTVVESWHHGEGQTRFDREDSLPYRFAASRGIDVWNKWGFGLLHDTNELWSFTDPGSEAVLLSVIDHDQLLAVKGTKWKYGAGPGLGQYEEGTFAAAAASVTNDGVHAYVSLVNGSVVKMTPGITMSVTTFTTLPVGGSELFYLKGFLVAATANVLTDITSPSLQQAIFTHPDLEFRWVDGADGPSFSYLLGGKGDKWYVFKMGLLEDATSFAPPSIATTLPEGELTHGIGGYLGYMLVGSDHGVRFMTPQGDGNLVYGQMIETTNAVRCFEGQGRFVWFGVDYGETGPPGKKQHRTYAERAIETVDRPALGRLDLSQFTAPLTPAAASDLEPRVPVSSGSVTGIGTIGLGLGKRVFAVGNTVWMENDDRVPQGTLIQGILNLDTADAKRAQYAQLTFEPLRGSVELAFSWDGGPTVSVAEATGQGEVGLGNVLLNSKKFTGAIPTVTLKRDANDVRLGPRVTRFEMRSQTELGKAHEWTVPVILSETMEYMGVTQERDVDSDFDLLVSLVETGRMFQYREGARYWSVYAVGERWLPTHPTRNGRAFNGVYVIQLREVR